MYLPCEILLDKWLLPEYYVNMTTEQQQNLSKYLYDISKIIFATIVLGPLINPISFRIWIIISGSIATVIILLLAYLLDGWRREEK